MDHKSHEVDCYPLKIKSFLYREIIIEHYENAPMFYTDFYSVVKIENFQ